MVNLKEIKEYCKGKTIAIVGNSSIIFDKKYGQFIDSNDIVIRMNHVLPLNPAYSVNIGTKTDMYTSSVSIVNTTLNYFKISKAKYNLILIRWNDNYTQNDIVYAKNINNLYIADYDDFIKFRYNYFGVKKNIKPSTGAAVLNFILTNIEYSKINLYGFDFFKNAQSSPTKMNAFKSYHYRDHNTLKEESYFKQMIETYNIYIHK